MPLGDSLAGRRIGIVIGIALIVSWMPQVAVPTSQPTSTHPYHVSIAEVEWDESSQKLQVALHVWPDDLEQALEKRFEREVDLEGDEAEVDALITSYLDERFRVMEVSPEERTGAEEDRERTAEIEWLGKELDLKSLWLYFEVPLEGEPDGIEFEQRMMFELLEDQTNLIQYKHARRRGTLRLTPHEPRKKLNYDDLRVGL